MLVKLREDAFDKSEIESEYSCKSQHKKPKQVMIKRSVLCGQLAEIIEYDEEDADEDCYKAWLPILQVFIICFKHRFEELL